MDWRKQVSTDLKMNRKIINLRRERKRRKNCPGRRGTNE